MAPHTSVPGQSACQVHLLLYFIISYVDAPRLWNIKMTMTGTILEINKRLLGALLINNNHNTRFEIEF